MCRHFFLCLLLVYFIWIKPFYLFIKNKLQQDKILEMAVSFVIYRVVARTDVKNASSLWKMRALLTAYFILYSAYLAYVRFAVLKADDQRTIKVKPPIIKE